MPDEMDENGKTNNSPDLPEQFRDENPGGGTNTGDPAADETQSIKEKGSSGDRKASNSDAEAPENVDVDKVEPEEPGGISTMEGEALPAGEVGAEKGGSGGDGGDVPPETGLLARAQREQMQAAGRKNLSPEDADHLAAARFLKICVRAGGASLIIGFLVTAVWWYLKPRGKEKSAYDLLTVARRLIKADKLPESVLTYRRIETEYPDASVLKKVRNDLAKLREKGSASVNLGERAEQELGSWRFDEARKWMLLRAWFDSDYNAGTDLGRVEKLEQTSLRLGNTHALEKVELFGEMYAECPGYETRRRLVAYARDQSRLLSRFDDYETALEMLDKTRVILGDTEVLAADLVTLRKIAAKHDIKGLLEEADRYRAAGDYRKGLELYTEARKRRPNSKEVTSGLVWALGKSLRNMRASADPVSMSRSEAKQYFSDLSDLARRYMDEGSQFDEPFRIFLDRASYLRWTGENGGALEMCGRLLAIHRSLPPEQKRRMEAIAGKAAVLFSLCAQKDPSLLETVEQKFKPVNLMKKLLSREKRPSYSALRDEGVFAGAYLWMAADALGSDQMLPAEKNLLLMYKSLGVVPETTDESVFSDTPPEKLVVPAAPEDNYAPLVDDTLIYVLCVLSRPPRSGKGVSSSVPWLEIARAEMESRIYQARRRGHRVWLEALEHHYKPLVKRFAEKAGSESR